MHITFASNQGDIAGGEVMLLALAQASRELGHDVRVVAPAAPSTLIDRATELEFPIVAIPGSGAGEYLRGLRRWDRRERTGLLWCNGLRPAVATTGHAGRVVHLHQTLSGSHRHLARVARLRALRTVVPSHFVQATVPQSLVLWNWTDDIGPLVSCSKTEGRFTVGFMGRLSVDKGVTVLCEALRRMSVDVRLLLAGESRFVPGEQVRAVETAVASLGSRVQRTAWIDRTAFFGEVDLAVFPSLATESFGLVAAEAMAAKCPFIVSDAGALPEVVGPEYPWVVPAGDATALAAAIDRAKAADWGVTVRRSHQRWVETFSPGAGRERLARLLTKIQVEHPGGR